MAAANERELDRPRRDAADDDRHPTAAALAKRRILASLADREKSGKVVEALRALLRQGWDRP